MNKTKYSIGLDFGTLSARAVIVNVANGEHQPCQSVFYYPNKIMTSLNGVTLPENYALQNPADYVAALEFLLPDVLTRNEISSEEVIGVGIDFTDCTIIPTDSTMTPLCFLKKYENSPHAYAKLWKHRAKEKYAKAVYDAAIKEAPEILSVTGNEMASEFMIPKLYEIFCEDREIYDATYKFISAGDFVASLLVGGTPIHSKAFSAKQHYIGDSYPNKKLFSSLDECFASVYEEKTVTLLTSVGSPIGRICPKWAKQTGLSEKTVVAAPIIDAHGAIPAIKISDGTLIAVLGTSAAVELTTKSKAIPSGMLAVSQGSVCEGLNTIEAGLAAMGDLFDWFIKNCLPRNYFDSAERLGMNIHEYLCSLAEKQRVGEHGLIAIDWWNGSRSVTLDGSLSGCIIGLRLSSKPEDIYRAILESTVFEIRRITDSLKSQNIPVNEIFATGGIANKNPFLMQIFADVLNEPIRCLKVENSSALGSAIMGAVAAGAYGSVCEASEKMRCPVAKTYYPVGASHLEYEKLYSLYCELHECLGKSNYSVMKALSDMREQ